MQMWTKILLALFLLCSPAWADDDDVVVVGQTVTAANPCAAYLICQGFEGTGYDNSESWTEVNQGSATINEDYAVEALVGSQSLYIVSGADNDTNDGAWAAFTAQTDVYGYFIIHGDSLSGSYSTDLVTIQTSVPGQIFAIYSNTSRQICFWDGSAHTSTYELTENTTHHVWWEYSTGAGDGVIKVYAAANATKPAATISVTNGNYSAEAARIFLSAARQNQVIYDKIRVKTSDIGSNPD